MAITKYIAKSVNALKTFTKEMSNSYTFLHKCSARNKKNSTSKICFPHYIQGEYMLLTTARE